MSRMLRVAALAGVAALTSGCVYLPATTEPARTATTQAPAAPAPTPAPVATQAPRETLSAEDRFMREAETITPQPHLIRGVRTELLAAGYSACDARLEGHSRATIIEVTHYSLGVDRHPDLFYSDAATTLTDAALTHLC